MDPNRNSLETLLKLPTHRLLTYFRANFSSFAYDEDEEGSATKRFEHQKAAIKEELARREHVSRAKTRKSH
jgi:hypothetical protein